jgi:hypothetical protein
LEQIEVNFNNNIDKILNISPRSPKKSLHTSNHVKLPGNFAKQTVTFDYLLNISTPFHTGNPKKDPPKKKTPAKV